MLRVAVILVNRPIKMSVFPGGLRKITGGNVQIQEVHLKDYMNVNLLTFSTLAG